MCMMRNNVVYVRRMPQSGGKVVEQLRANVLHLNFHADVIMLSVLGLTSILPLMFTLEIIP